MYVYDTMQIWSNMVWLFCLVSGLVASTCDIFPIGNPQLCNEAICRDSRNQWGNLRETVMNVSTTCLRKRSKDTLKSGLTKGPGRITCILPVYEKTFLFLSWTQIGGFQKFLSLFACREILRDFTASYRANHKVGNTFSIEKEQP